MSVSMLPLLASPIVGLTFRMFRKSSFNPWISMVVLAW
jgi:hypothetical protein